MAWIFNYIQQNFAGYDYFSLHTIYFCTWCHTIPYSDGTYVISVIHRRLINYLVDWLWTHGKANIKYAHFLVLMYWETPSTTHCWQLSWWRHEMEAFPALLTVCAGNSLVTGEFPTQNPVTRTFDVFFDLRLNKRLSIQSKRRWFETPPCSLWRHCNGKVLYWLPLCDQVTYICVTELDHER